MPMNHTRSALHLSRYGQPSESAVSAAADEVATAEEVASLLRQICEAHWKEATHLDMRALVRRAESLLPKVGG
jgi:hypothetical protein